MEENKGKNEEINLKQDFINKEILQSYLEFISKINFTNDKEAEKITYYIIQCFSDLSNSNFFSQQIFDDSENYFITQFCPIFIKKISNEKISSKSVKDNLWGIINCFINEMITGLECQRLFDVWDALIDFLSEDKTFISNYHNDVSEKFLEIKYDTFNPNSAEWKRKLSCGDIIDCLQKDMEINFNVDGIGVACWTRAIIISIENKILKIKYLGTGENTYIPLSTPQIFPAFSLSFDFDWRESIKSGDEIDFLDSKSWYRSTVIETIEKQTFNSSYKYIKFGLRIYRENGKCKDNKGKTYFGWSESFDKIVSVHDPRVRMPNRFSKIIENYDLISSYPIENKKFNDLETYIPFQINNIYNFILPKKPKDYKRLDIDYFNSLTLICEKGGLEMLLSILKKKISLTYELFSLIIGFIYNIHEYLHYQFAKFYLKDFIKYCLEYLIHFSVSEMRNFTKDKLESTIRKLREISYKIYMENDINAKFDKFMIEFGLGCISSTTLDKKLIGIKYLSSSLLEAIRVNLGQIITSSFNDKRLHYSILIERIKEKNIIDYIFGNSSHIQLIQRSNDLVKSLLMCNALSQEDLIKIYDLTKSNDSETKKSIYKILQINYNHFTTDLAAFLIYKILNKNPETINSFDLELIEEIYKSMNASKQIELSKFIANSYKDFILNYNLDSQINENLINELVRILKTFEMRDHRLIFIENLLKGLKNKKNIGMFIKVLKIIRRFVLSFNSPIDDYHRFKIMKLLVEDYLMIDMIIENISNYHSSYVNNNESLNEESIEKLCIYERCSHNDFITEIFSFFSFLLHIENDLMFNEKNLDCLFTVFVENPASKREINLFFKWLKEADDKNLLTNDFYNKIFNRMILSETLEFSNINIDFYNTIWNIFISINKNLCKIDFKSHEKNNSINVKKGERVIKKFKNKEEFMLECEPFDLEGFNLIWKLVIVCPEGDVRKTAIDNFIKLFSCNSLTFNTQAKLWEALITKCISAIKVIKSQEKSQEKDLKIINIFCILKGLIEESEKKGTAGVKSHGSISKKRNITITVLNKILSKLTKSEVKEFAVKVNGNINIWELKELIAFNLGTTPHILKLYLGNYVVTSDNLNQEISIKDHGKTINELKIMDSCTITVLKNDALNKINRVNLINEKGDLSDKLIVALSDIFEHYSTGKLMTTEQFAKFINVAYDASEPYTINDYMIVNLFEKYIIDEDQLSREGFFRYFRNLIDYRSSNCIAWKMLKRLGYMNDLRKFNDSINVIREFLPRYSISCNKIQFEEIFFLQNENEAIAKEAYIFLSIISTNLNYYDNFISAVNIINSSQINEEFWVDLISSSNYYKVLYNLQIIQSFFEELRNNTIYDQSTITVQNNQPQIDISIRWIKVFLERGGINHFAKILMRYNQKYSFFMKKCLILTIRILKDSFKITFRSIKHDKNLESILRGNLIKEQIVNQLNINPHVSCTMNEINYGKLSLSLIKIVNDSLENEFPENEDYITINNSLKLLNLLIISQSNLSILSEDITTNSYFEHSVILGTLITKGNERKSIFCKNLRKLISILFQFQKFTLIYFLINLFFKKSLEVPFLETIPEKSFFFNLFEFIVNHALQYACSYKSIDFNELVIRFTDTIVEKKDNYLEEEIFIGYLKLINIIITKNQHLNSILGNDKYLITVLIENYAFKEINLINSNQFNQCEEKDSTFIETDKIRLNKDRSYTNQESIKLIYNLIINLISGEKKNLDILFSTLLRHIPNQLKSRLYLNYDPFSEKKSQYNYVGIKNLGCICYMNSMLQQFFCIPSFRYCILQINDTEIAGVTQESTNFDDNVLHQLQNMFTFLELSDRKYYSPKGFCNAFKDLDGKPTNISIQQDAQEFLGRLFDVLEVQTKKTQFKYLLQSVFGGKSCTQLICEGGCGTVKNNIEDFYNLSLEVKNHKTLKESLDKYISEERIEDYKCDVCKKNVSLVKRNSLAELPNVLIVHLQRILFDYDNLKNNKINSRLDFPCNLNLKQYSSEVLSSSSKSKEESGFNNSSSFSNYIKEDSYYEYDLVGVVVHTGSADAGHYYSLININREGFENDQSVNPEIHEDHNNLKNWLEFNDSNINLFNIKNLEDECFGGFKMAYEENSHWLNQHSEEKEKCKNAYMLIYERKKKKPIKMVLDSNRVSNKDLVFEINSVNKNEVLKSYDIFNFEILIDEDSNKKTIFDYIFFDKELEEYLYFTPFYNIKKLVFKNHFDDIITDNMVFFNDQKIFHRNFNEFIYNVLNSLNKIIYDDGIDEKSVENIFYISVIYLLEVFSISYYKDYINEIVKTMCSIMKKFPYLSNDVLKKSIQIKSNLIDIIFSQDELSNKSFTTLFLYAVNLIFEIKQNEIKNELLLSNDNLTIMNKEKIQVFELLDLFISWLPSQVSKNWTKMSAFLEFFQNLSQSGNLQIQFLMSREIIYRLIDFFLGKESPYCKTSENRYEIGSKTISPGFHPLIATIANLSSHCFTDKWGNKQLKKGKYPHDYVEGKKFELSNRDRDCIILKLFYQKSIKEKHNSESIGKILAHFMFNNLEFTKKRLYLLIEMLNDSFGTEIKEFFEIFQQIFKIQDKYSKLRLEYIFGIPQYNVKSKNGSKPQIIKYEGRYSDNLIWFYSPILYNTSYSSVIDQFVRFISNCEILTILNCLYSMLFTNPMAFNYFDNCPSPIRETKSLNDYFLDIINEELLTNNVFLNQKNNYYIIEKSRNLSINYNEKRKEFLIKGYLHNLYLKTDYRLKRIINETITLDTSLEILNKKNVYLLTLDYDIEITVNHNKINLQNSNLNENVKNDYKTNFNKNSLENNFEIENNIEEIGNLEDINNFSNIRDDDLFNIENNFLNEEDFYRNIVLNLFENEKITRKIIKLEINSYSNIQNCLRRYLIVNSKIYSKLDSERDYKIKLKFTIDNTIPINNYIPDSEVIVTIKKFSISNALTLLKFNNDLAFNILEVKAEISYYDFGKDDYSTYNHFNYDMNNKSSKESRWDYHEIPTAPDLSNDERNLISELKPVSFDDSTTKNTNENYDYKMNPSDYFNLDCSHCRKTNYYSNNCMTYICKYCLKDPFE